MRKLTSDDLEFPTEACLTSRLGQQISGIAIGLRHGEREVDRRRKRINVTTHKIAERAGDVTPLTLGEERMLRGDAVLTCVPQLGGEGINYILIVSVGGRGVIRGRGALMGEWNVTVV